ncbi:MAG TPA: ATP-binding protein, partial [Desulfohalobiaceae bacterium]|nr:ATP-binding protein [Desulfohalobiaceae bacterium]
HQYRSSMRQETVSQLRVLVNKTKHSTELFLQERLSTVKYIAHAYSYQQLSDEQELHKIFYTMQQNFSGFVDIGLINPEGLQVNYVGPYHFEGKDYSDHAFYQEVKIEGSYISDVFMGYRKFPHIVIAVERKSIMGNNWILRATINIENFNDIIASMGLGPDSDAFLLNKEGVVQTPSKFYGDVLDKCPFEIPPKTYQPTVKEIKDPKGDVAFLAYVYFPQLEYILVVVKPRSQILQSWYALKDQMIVVLIAGLLVIVLVVYKLTYLMVKRIRQADEKREVAFRELEHTHKLSSIGRMAAGIAHEVNNPLAIINENTGLMKDLVQSMPEFPKRDKFIKLTDSILKSVERARGITYRLLGFARRLEVQYELLDVNKVIQEVLGFLEKEAKDRNVDVQLALNSDLDNISSDQGQLEQIFLNILTNALAAVDDGGHINIKTREENLDTVAVIIQDNGCGMSQETLEHLFEPFFTTKKGYGTGLGLSITYGLVKKLGGDIRVQSQLGVGTSFTVLLPKNKPSS